MAKQYKWGKEKDTSKGTSTERKTKARAHHDSTNEHFNCDDSALSLFGEKLMIVLRERDNPRHCPLGKEYGEADRRNYNVKGM